MSSNYVPYGEVYSDQQYGSRDRRPDRARVQEIAAEDIDTVRQQQLDAFYRPAPPRDDELRRRGQDRRSWQRERSADDAQYASRRRRRPQRRDSRSSSESDSESPPDRRRDQKASGRRAQSERPPSRSQPRHYDGDYQGLVARNLDSSPNGVLAAAVGAGIGAIGARRYGANHFNPEKGNSHWKTIGGAVVGGIAANAAENRWHKYREEKKKSREGAEDGS